ncbi:hypothetical protein VDG1235_1082 [Verrucomicrobiia bacterium DG1235]|nr:hypothetical protein VDG1235_1082 [Verrucomicrobiae bacterium DG1235]
MRQLRKVSFGGWWRGKDEEIWGAKRVTLRVSRSRGGAFSDCVFWGEFAAWFL